MIQAGIIQPIDYAGRVQQGFAQGQQMRRQADMEKALQALAANPNDPKAISAITRVNPEMGMRLQSQRAAQEQAAREERIKVFGAAARMAKNPEQWDMIADKLVELGYSEAAAAKGKFSPETRTRSTWPPLVWTIPTLPATGPITIGSNRRFPIATLPTVGLLPA